MSKYSFRDLVIDSRTGLNPRKNFKLGNGNNYYITIKDIHNGKIKITDKTDRIDDAAVKIIKKRSRIQNGDILFTSIGRIGETAIVQNKNDTWEVNESIFIFTINREIVDAEFFCILFQSSALQKRLIKESSGSTFKSIKMNQLEKFSFDIPSIKEQKKIVTNIKATTRLIDLCNAILEKLDLLVKAKFVEMFGEIDNVKTISDVCSIITDGTHQPPQFTQSGIPFLFVSNIATNEITYNAEKYISEDTYNELYKRTPIEIGDIVLSTVGSYGHPAIVKSDKKFLFQRHIAYLKPIKNIINSIYLHNAILSEKVQEQIEDRVKGIAQKTLNLSEIRKIKISVPPLPLQEKFADFVKQTDKSRSAVKQVLEKAETLKKALMQDYFK